MPGNLIFSLYTHTRYCNIKSVNKQKGRRDSPNYKIARKKYEESDLTWKLKPTNSGFLVMLYSTRPNKHGN